MARVSTHSPPILMIDCFNLKTRWGICLFLALFIPLTGAPIGRWQVPQFQFPELLPTKKKINKMLNASNNGLSLYQPHTPDTPPHLWLGQHTVRQSLYSSKWGDRSNRQTFGILCAEMWCSTKMELAIQLSRCRWNAHCMKTDFFKKGGSQNLIAPCWLTLVKFKDLSKMKLSPNEQIKFKNPTF